ncbi:MAG TPA: DUF4911 domain-containing protein [Thermotogaceae bacterium]|nr:DUF4911 domain-containing protein [Thermotogota bacterium]HEW91361.1 DUF4911 domain-containing protein [Thermotogaceae bacterium]
MVEEYRYNSNIKEFDIYLKIEKEDVHILNYIIEAEDNMLNIRKFDSTEKLLKVIVPVDFLEDVLELLNSLKSEVQFEIVKYEPNRGMA